MLSAGASAGPAGGPPRRCAVLGRPVAHSLSPVLHRAAYRELGLGWEYDAVEVGGDELPGFLASRDASWRGLSLTMPLKRSVMPLLDDASETALAAGAANTVLLGEGGRRSGHNTDVPGVRLALAERGVERVAVLALARMGCRQVTLLVREPARAGEVVEAAGRLPDAPVVRLLRLEDLDALEPRADVVVSTIPARAQAALAGVLVKQAPVVFDVIYDPWPTPLARAAADAGRTVVGGLDLLVHQAPRQGELMTGCEKAPLAAMRAAGEAALRGSPAS